MDYDNEKMALNQRVAQLEKELAVARRCARLWKGLAKYYRKQYKCIINAVQVVFGYRT